MKFDDNKIEGTKFSKKSVLKSNKTVNSLWGWAQTLEVIGIIGAIGVAVYGVISLIGLIKLRADGGTIFLFLLQWVFYTFLEYCAFHSVALIISAIGNINYNTMVTAKAALANAELVDDETAAKEEAQAETSQEYSATFKIFLDHNMISSNYPVALVLDGEPLDSNIDDGRTLTYTKTLKGGEHELKAYKIDDETICGTFRFILRKDTELMLMMLRKKNEMFITQ